MTRDQILAMAREAGFGNLVSIPHIDALSRFASLVAAAEREACAKVCEFRLHREYNSTFLAVTSCKDAIRARKD